MSQNRSEVSPRPSSSSSSLSDGNRHKARRPVMMVVALSLQAGHRSPRWLPLSPDGSEVCPQTGRRSARRLSSLLSSSSDGNRRVGCRSRNDGCGVVVTSGLSRAGRREQVVAGRIASPLESVVPGWVGGLPAQDRRCEIIGDFAYYLAHTVSRYRYSVTVYFCTCVHARYWF